MATRLEPRCLAGFTLLVIGRDRMATTSTARMNRLHFSFAGNALACCAQSRKPPRFEQGLHARPKGDTPAQPSFLLGWGECKPLFKKGPAVFCAQWARHAG
ncbi:hypothetical protein [Limnobacter thiooxidans]|uniref:hypothetical protein n=1 Tax=Limnobacter thiooxidans TaxID=131080 RepID=UPI00102DC7D0